MRLYKVKVTHWSPKDSHTSIEGFVVATNEEQVIEWIPNLDGWEDWEADEVGEVYPSESWWKEHSSEADRARSMGLTVELCDWGEREGKPEAVMGLKTILLRWWRGDFEEVSDLHYGATQWKWDEGKPISADDAAVLVGCGVAVSLCEPG